MTSGDEVFLAALSGSADTGAVLTTARGFADLVGVGVEAIHVEDGEAAGDPGREAHAAGVVIHGRRGPVAEEILDAMASPRVFGAAMGSRTFIGGPRPAGSTALRVLGATSKPVIFVPPESAVAGPFVPRRASQISARPASENRRHSAHFPGHYTAPVVQRGVASTS